MRISDITVLTCTFNNNLLTKHMIMSLFKALNEDIDIVIVDNGTTELCDRSIKDHFTVIDNSNFKLTPDYHQISKNHSSTIDYALKNLVHTKYALLCDNDILFKPTIRTLIENTSDDIDCVGEIGFDIIKPERLFPYMCIINVEKFKNEKMNYFDEKRCMRLFDKNRKEVFDKGFAHSGLYDTGYSFYEDIKKDWKIKRIKLDDYIVHLKGAYRTSKNGIEMWLKKNSALF